MYQNSNSPLVQPILESIQRSQLPLKLDTLTEGDGNCFSRAVVSQCQRESVKEVVETPIKSYMMLKKNVASFMKTSRHPVVKAYKREYQKVLQPVTKESWEQYWLRMQQDTEWADAVYVQGTAWYLMHDIHIMPTTATAEAPFITFSGNRERRDLPCPGAALLLGYTGLHYQSLLETSEERIHMPNFKP